MNNKITTLVGVVFAALISIGLVMIYSATMGQKDASYFRNQLMWSILGLGVFAVCFALDYRLLKRWSIVLYIVAFILLLLVFVPGLGKKVNGAQRWISISQVNFQPSEFAKLALIILLAHYCERYQRNIKKFVPGVLVPLGVTGFMAGLIILGKDYGTTILTGVVCISILIVAGVRWVHILPIILLGAALLSAAVMSNANRRARVMAWIYPERYIDTYAYQVEQAKVAIGSGKLLGKGAGDGRFKLGYVPENHTDFIFTIIGEELGFIGAGFVLLCYVLFVLCGALIAFRASDMFGFLLGFGITTMIGIQAFVNIGVVTGVLPNKGLPLPFISYGGSNLMMCMAAVGILLSIARFSNQTEKSKGLVNSEVPI